MIRKGLGIANYLLLFMVLVLPFYLDFSFVNIFIPYAISAIWFVFLLSIGFKVAFSYFLLFAYIGAALIFFSYGFDNEVFIGMLLGLISSICIYFSRGMDSYE
jgi:hypothetical protein|tara:strand:- start:561 stop:869 length:309 start_codon:yes stop_codon:yes gene_type:complete